MSRPKLCRECHAPATYAETEMRPAAVLRRDGSMDRFTEPVTVYWCDDHTGIKSALWDRIEERAKEPPRAIPGLRDFMERYA